YLLPHKTFCFFYADDIYLICSKKMWDTHTIYKCTINGTILSFNVHTLPFGNAGMTSVTIQNNKVYISFNGGERYACIEHDLHDLADNTGQSIKKNSLSIEYQYTLSFNGRELKKILKIDV